MTGAFLRDNKTFYGHNMPERDVEATFISVLQLTHFLYRLPCPTAPGS